MSNPVSLTPKHLRNINVTVLGLGRFGGGVAVVNYLLQHGAKVTLTDSGTAASLSQSLKEIDTDRLIATFFENHPEEAFEKCELVVVNPAVRPDHPALELCQKLNIPVVTDIELLLHCLQNASAVGSNAEPESTMPEAQSLPPPSLPPPSPALKSTGPFIIGVTGSNGKSTTSALIFHLLSHSFQSDQETGCVETDVAGLNRRCWLGGNIGTSLLPLVEQIAANDVVVLELSSFQLHYLQKFRMALDVAVVTNLTENHLDWHPDFNHYKTAKQQILRHQTTTQVAVIPVSHLFEGQPDFRSDGDFEAPVWRARGRRFQFGTMDDGQDGVFLEEGTLVVREKGIEDAVRLSLSGPLAGEHNRRNVTAAACAALQAGADLLKIPAAVRSFQGLPFRMENSGRAKGIRFINDSASTTPESTIAAIRSIKEMTGPSIRSSDGRSQKLVAIVGGADKGACIEALVDEMVKNCDGIVAIGAVGVPLQAALAQHDRIRQGQVVSCDDFGDAFAQAVALAASGGIVLFSPGFSSFGWFRDYVVRGQQFDLLVNQWMHS